MKKKIVITVIMFIVSICLAYILSSFVQAAMNIKANNSHMDLLLLSQYFCELLKNPFSTIRKMCSDLNPIWLLSCIGAVFISLYVGFIKNKDKKYQIENSYTVHGAARWGKRSEFKNYLSYQDKDDVLNQFFKGLKNE